MNLRCIYCSWLGPSSDFEVDHMFPVSRGGSDLFWNKQWICSGCNREKRDKTHTEYQNWRFMQALFGQKVNFGPIGLR